MNPCLKTLFLFLFVNLFCLSLFCQTKYGNEWIDNAKIYYKIKVAKDGIYKVTFEDMINAGFPQASVAASSLKLINFGKEQAIDVSNSNFGPGEFFLFYGQKNTIGLDSLLYTDWKKDLFNSEYSIITDTNAYFLTISPETSNLRFIQVNPDYSNITLSPTQYYIHEEKIVYNSVYTKNEERKIRQSYLEPCEGFGSGYTNLSTVNISTNRLIESGPLPLLSIRTGISSLFAKLDVSWNNDLLESRFLNPNVNAQFDFTLNKEMVKSNNTLTIKNMQSANDKHSLAFASLVYPRSFHFNNQTNFFFKLTSSTNKRLLEINDFKTNNNGVFLFDIDQKIKYRSLVDNNTVKVITNPISSENHYILVNEIEGYEKINEISVFVPQKFDNVDQNYLIITHKFLFDNVDNPVQEYADYRNSEAGGNHKVDIREVYDIYNHFGYGIDRHFMSIKNLGAYIKKNWPALKTVLILGKAVEYPYMRTTKDVIDSEGRIFFVPTYGFTGSDNMLFSEGNYPDPHFAVGRIAARTKEDIRNYLDKVKDYEKAPLLDQTYDDKFWMKRVLHLGGGKEPQEQVAIKSGLELMASYLADSIYGGQITAYYKQSFAAIQFGVNEDITRLVNTGLSFINFYGHSAPDTWDFPIESPKNYTNKGRYPFINSFGCYSGNLHSATKGISESFVLEKERGSIAFFASTGTAFIPSLTRYGNQFYQALLNDKRFQSFGEVIRHLAEKNREAISDELALYAQLTYHGDPAIKPYLSVHPDFIFNDRVTKTLPQNVQASLPSFEVKVDLVNIGALKKDSVDILFYHQLPSGNIVDSVRLKVANTSSSMTVTVPLKNYGKASIGKNTILGKIDPSNKIFEAPDGVAELNNTLNKGQGFDFFVTDNLASTIYPPDFGIINTKDHFVLKASTSSVPINKSKYVFQIDTTLNFNSAYLERGEVESEGGLIQYVPKNQLLENTAYYWRISADSIDEKGFNWSDASFVYLPNEKEGWNQSHFFQYTKNEFSDLKLSNKRQFVLGENLNTAKVRNKLWNVDDRPVFMFNNIRIGSATPWLILDAGICIIRWEQKIGTYIFNPPGGAYGSFSYIPPNTTAPGSTGFAFKTDTPEDRLLVMKFIEEVIQPGEFVTFFTFIKTEASDFKVADWSADEQLYGKSIFSVLEKKGAAKVRRMSEFGSVPYFVQYFQDMDSTKLINEEVATTKTEIIEATGVFTNFKKLGKHNSTLIGPSKNWDELKFDFSEDVGLNKGAFVDVFGVDATGKETKIESFLKEGAKKIDMSAADYPYIKLKSTVADSSKFEAPQLEFWRATYTSLPDAAIVFGSIKPDPNKTLLNQGQEIKFLYEIQNVNNVDMDSILVKHSFISNENQQTNQYIKLPPLKAGQKISHEYTLTAPTSNVENFRVVIEVNPDNNQPELYRFNNTISRQIDMAKDRKNPLLEVYFDGLQIMDGDIVSPRPEIMVVLEDDNAYLPINDPTLFDIKLDTGRFQFMEIAMDGPDVKFIPSDNTNNAARVIYTPNLKEGDYALIVQGKDVSGNKSALNPKRIGFRVIEKQSVSNVLNYPNPFSTSTQFIFTLTGEEMPEIMSITIMTITGKVVKEITREMLGPLRIGINRTEYKWDGTDEYGSKLANGVYLYKVNIKKANGDNYEAFANSKIDGLFTEGFGKLVILR